MYAWHVETPSLVFPYIFFTLVLAAAGFFFLRRGYRRLKELFKSGKGLGGIVMLIAIALVFFFSAYLESQELFKIWHPVLMPGPQQGMQ